MQIPRDETGHCKGFGFVQVGRVSVSLDYFFSCYCTCLINRILFFFLTFKFARLEDARNALNLNGQLEIAGRAIKVVVELIF